MEKKTDNNAGHPLLGKSYPDGKCPKILVSIAYQKQCWPSRIIGTSNGK